MRGRAGLGGVGGQGESLVGFEGHRLEHEAQDADGRMAELLDAAAVQAYVMCRPQGSELLTAGGQFADKAGEGGIERVTACFCAQQRDGGVRGVGEVGVEVARGGVEEPEPG